MPHMFPYFSRTYLEQNQITFALLLPTRPGLLQSTGPDPLGWGSERGAGDSALCTRHSPRPRPPRLFAHKSRFTHPNLPAHPPRSDELRVPSFVDGVSSRADGAPSHMDGVPSQVETVSTAVDGAPSRADGVPSFVDGVSSCADGPPGSVSGASPTPHPPAHRERSPSLWSCPLQPSEMPGPAPPNRHPGEAKANTDPVPPTAALGGRCALVV